jgi:hypothetical protein
MRPNVRIVIDPVIVYANEAPGGRDSTIRDAGRSAYLTQALGARAERRSSVSDCSAGPCVLRGADVLVTLAQPAISGDDARVTVTTVRQTNRGIQYMTVDVVMKRRGNLWQVLGFEDLGIS